jgi:hypothetical protein
MHVSLGDDKDMRRFAKIYIPRAEIEPQLQTAHVVRFPGTASRL